MKNTPLKLAILLLSLTMGKFVYANPCLDSIDRYVDSNEKKLKLSSCNIIDNDLPIIIDYLNKDNSITFLDLSYNNISDSGLITLSNAINLVKLDLSYNTHLRGESNFSTLLQLPKLAELKLSGDSLNSEAMSALAKSPSIVKLNMSSSEFYNGSFSQFATNLQDNTKLEDLNLSYTAIAYDIYYYTNVFSNNKTIKYLNVSNCKIESLGISNIARNIPSLLTLDASHNNIGSDGAIALSKNKNITELNLNYNQVGDIGAVVLSNNKTLAKLALNYNNIGDKGVESLAANTTLSILSLSWNKITDTGAIALAATTTLKELDVTNNHIQSVGINALITNQHLDKLLIEGNPGINNSKQGTVFSHSTPINH